MNKQDIFRQIPSVDEVLDQPLIACAVGEYSRNRVIAVVRAVFDEYRVAIAKGDVTESLGIDELVRRVLDSVQQADEASLRKVINATGIIIHTNLGRSVLPREAVDAVVEVASSYSTLEYDVETAQRGSRHDHVEALLCELTGAEAAMAVNNNAAAVMMVIACFARGKEAIVSRGELVEIGGSFRVPDVMAESGAMMVEVGTTNKTHIADYANAITDLTGLLLKVHTSNYRVVGFVSNPSLDELVALGDARGIPVMEDQGSGVLIDLTKYGLPAEPTVQESVARGATVVTFSGDKLLGGPQAGIIVGRKEAIARLKKHPLARALRLDKMTLAALESTLKLYRNPETLLRNIPTLDMLTRSAESIKAEAQSIANRLESALGATATIRIEREVARAGGGSLPLADIDSWVVSIEPHDYSESDLEEWLRTKTDVPIITRVRDGRVLIDPRTLIDTDDDVIVECIAQFAQAAK